jgi:hypothetical protein
LKLYTFAESSMQLNETGADAHNWSGFNLGEHPAQKGLHCCYLMGLRPR